MKPRNDYGGAYDIEPDQFFTREDLVEFSEAICDELRSHYGKEFEVSDLYMDTPTRAYISVVDEYGDGASTFVDIDMRKIRKPSDLIHKYLKPVSDELKAIYDNMMTEYSSEEVESAEEVPDSAFPDWWWNGPSGDADYEEPFCEEVDIDVSELEVTLEADGNWDISVADIIEEFPENILSDRYDSLELISREEIAEQLEVAVYDILPDDPGLYTLSGVLSIKCCVENIWADDYEEGATHYHVDDAEIDYTPYFKDYTWTEIR